MKCWTSQVCDPSICPPHRACMRFMPVSLLCLLGILTSFMSGSHADLFCLCFFLTFALEKLLSKRSRASPAQDEASSQTDIDSVSPSPAPADPGAAAELHKQIEELTSQNAELVLKVQVRQRKCINTQLMHKYLLSHMQTCWLINKDKLVVKRVLIGSLAGDEDSVSRVAECPSFKH